MTETINRLEQLLKSGLDCNSQSSESELTQKPFPEKWSKKEILGHLIDSGINNLQRFSEIQFSDKPYKIRPYNQGELVRVNHYQAADINEIVNFWVVVNRRIVNLMKIQTETTLNYAIETSEGQLADLRFLMIDYVDHLEHHLNQIMKNNRQKYPPNRIV